jgi:ATP-binding cassette subfamily B (MDR/TAP) protein 1
MNVGYFFAVITGLAMPSFVFLFGNIINSYGPDEDPLSSINRTCLQLTLIGCGVWVTAYFYFSTLVIMSERVAMKTRIAYLRAILMQEVGWFDTINVTELASKLSRECQAIQIALSEKMGLILLSMSMSISGLFFAFFRGWWFSCILLFAFPALCIGTMFIGVAI